MLNLCIPTLKRYDKLYELIDSAEAGTVKPDNYYIINNGIQSVDIINNKMTIYNPGYNMGVAKSWNWFIENVPETRLIANDDIVLYPNTLQLIVEYIEKNPDILLWFPSSVPAQNVFSFFGIKDECINRIGLFDENFAPAYYEDGDYMRRMILEKIPFGGVDNCSYGHENSSTLQYFTSIEMEAHHRNFRKNQIYYLRKWGGLPGHEIYTIPFNQ